jgi:hypothetical protein
VGGGWQSARPNKWVVLDDYQTGDQLQDDYQNARSINSIVKRDDYQMLDPLGFEIDRVRVDYQTDDC